MNTYQKEAIKDLTSALNNMYYMPVDDLVAIRKHFKKQSQNTAFLPYERQMFEMQEAMVKTLIKKKRAPL